MWVDVSPSTWLFRWHPTARNALYYEVCELFGWTCTENNSDWNHMPYYQCCAIYPHMLAVEQPTSSLQTWWLARPLVKWITLRHTPVNRLPEEDAQAARHRMAFPPHWLVCQHQHEFRSWEFLRTKLQPFLGPTTSRKDSCATMCLHHQQNSHGWQMVTDCIVCIYIYISNLSLPLRVSFTFSLNLGLSVFVPTCFNEEPGDGMSRNRRRIDPIDGPEPFFLVPCS